MQLDEGETGRDSGGWVELRQHRLKSRAFSIKVMGLGIC
jgi:hypothetical protein